MYAFAGLSSASKLSTNDHAFTLGGANGISTKGFKWFLGGPPVRYSQSAFYDSVTNGLFVFAGAHAGTLFFNDYWEASDVIGSSNLTWTQLLPKGTKPSARWGHTGLYDSASNRMMVFAGATGASTCVNDYHVLEFANGQGGTVTWLTVVPSVTAPAIRTRHASVYDPSTNTLIIFGGFNCKSTYYNDVWILSNANDLTAQPSWKQLLTTGTKPAVRESSSAVYDSFTNSLIVYGGDKGGAPLGDIWILSHANGTGGTPTWTELSPSNNGPGARSGHTATYDTVNNLMTIYAGFNGAQHPQRYLGSIRRQWTRGRSHMEPACLGANPPLPHLRVRSHLESDDHFRRRHRYRAVRSIVRSLHLDRRQRLAVSATNRTHHGDTETRRKTRSGETMIRFLQELVFLRDSVSPWRILLY